MTRLERIKFIRENSNLYTNTNFSDYDDDDLFRLYHTIPLSSEKEKERNNEFPIISWWGRISMKLPSIHNEDASWNFPKNIISIIWIFLFNPFCLLLYLTALIIFLMHYAISA